MVETGFHVESILYVYHESIHESKEKLKAWVKQWLPHQKYLSVMKRDVFLDELIDSYLMEIGVSSETSGPVHSGEYVLIVEGVKG
ncbi:MAG: hypothetical protein V4489_01915 [Chlamydiota bacterium]